MGHIRSRKLKNGGFRYQAEVRLKGYPTLTAMFDRSSDAKFGFKKQKQILGVVDNSFTQKEVVILLKKL